MQLKTDFSDGDVFYSGTTSDNFALNGITNEVNRKGVIYRKVYESAAEVTTTETSIWETGKSFTITAPVGSLVIGLIFIADLMAGGSTQASVSTIKISGTNLGNKLLGNILWGSYGGNGGYVLAYDLGLSGSLGGIYNVGRTMYETISSRMINSFVLEDEITTFSICLRATSGTAYIKNVRVEVIYIENFKEDA